MYFDNRTKYVWTEMLENQKRVYHNVINPFTRERLLAEARYHNYGWLTSMNYDKAVT